MSTTFSDPLPTQALSLAAPFGTAAMAVSFAGLGKSFGSGSSERTVLRDVNFDVRPGEILAILGSSGCGKSTLLRAAAGLDSPSRGSVFIDGTVVSGFDFRCAVAFQEPRLLPWKSVSANVSLGIPAEISKAEAAKNVAELLHLVGLGGFAKHRPREISGGMAQRTSLARALARNPGVLLLDEPFGALDALTRIKMQDLLLDIHAAEPTTVLLVTHDVDEAIALADRIIVLGEEQGAATGATIIRTIDVPGHRRLTRADTSMAATLAALRSSLLASLGVTNH